MTLFQQQTECVQLNGNITVNKELAGMWKELKEGDEENIWT
jgi:hypothetical protein